jgi:hypothetical protein
MTEIDELRRVAYGRTSTPAEEAASAAARSQLAALEAPQPETCQPSAHDAPAESVQPADDGFATAAFETAAFETHDEPGYLRRLAYSWRVWAVPAFVTFVIGIAITAASGLFVLQGLRTTAPQPISVGDSEPGSQPGNLERARALLGSAQSADDIAPMVNESVDPATTHALVSPSHMRFFGANSLKGHFCLIAVDDAAGSSISTCAPPERFARDGVWVGTIADGVNLTLRWDGEKVTETRTPQ